MAHAKKCVLLMCHLPPCDALHIHLPVCDSVLANASKLCAAEIVTYGIRCLNVRGVAWHDSSGGNMLCPADHMVRKSAVDHDQCQLTLILASHRVQVLVFVSVTVSRLEGVQ